MSVFRPFPHQSSERIFYVVIALIRASLVVAATWAIVLGAYEMVGMSVLAFGLTLLPRLFESRYRIYLPIEFHLVIVAFLYASVFLGSASGAYKAFGWWDIVLHLSSGIVLGFFGFIVLYILREQQKLRMSLWWIAFFTFCVGLATGVLWEFYEFGMDQFFGKEMQHGNFDTMTDLMTDALGAVIVAVGGYYHLKNVKVSLFTRAVHRFIAHNPKLFSKK